MSLLYAHNLIEEKKRKKCMNTNKEYFFNFKTFTIKCNISKGIILRGIKTVDEKFADKDDKKEYKEYLKNGM